MLENSWDEDIFLLFLIDPDGVENASAVCSIVVVVDRNRMAARAKASAPGSDLGRCSLHFFICVLAMVLLRQEQDLDVLLLNLRIRERNVSLGEGMFECDVKLFFGSDFFSKNFKFHSSSTRDFVRDLRFDKSQIVAFGLASRKIASCMVA